MTDLLSPFRPGSPALLCALINGEKVIKPVIVVEALSNSITVRAISSSELKDTLPADGHRLPGTPHHVWLEAS